MRSILLTSLFSVTVFLVNAQFSNSVKGMTYLNISAGVSKYSLPGYFELGVGNLLKERIALSGAVGYEHGKVGETLLNIWSLHSDFEYSVLNYDQKVYFNVGVGPYLGGEFLKSSIDNRITKNQFIFGGRGMTSVEYALNERFSIEGEYQQWYDRFSHLGDWHYTFLINLNINLN